MKLVDLEPRWVGLGDASKRPQGETLIVGMTFLCPHCRARRLAVMFANPIDPAGYISPGVNWPAAGYWTRNGGTFDALSLTPSIDTEREGHWHGTIINGEVVP